MDNKVSHDNNNTKYHDAVRHFAGSKMFFKLFDETISLVQKVSDYLEGVGRYSKVKMDEESEQFFAAESVKMTNRLMQTSSWLLSQRAFYKGEIDEPRNIDLKSFLDKNGKLALDKTLNNLPSSFTLLLTKSHLLFERIMRLDIQLKKFKADTETIVQKPNILSQFERLNNELSVFKNSQPEIEQKISSEE